MEASLLRGVLNILRDPIYAGAYRYGRTAVTTVAREGRLQKRTVRKPLGSCRLSALRSLCPSCAPLRGHALQSRFTRLKRVPRTP